MYFTIQTAIPIIEKVTPVATTDKLLCAALVTLMQLGFACLEAGLVDARNTLSILYKNTLDFCFGFLVFIVVWTTVFGAPATEPSEIADLLYNATFATTAATICSGALAGRIRLTSYVWLSMFMTGLVYAGAAKFLFDFQAPNFTTFENGNFYDLAGSVTVHAIGGFSAAAAALYVAPRKGFRQIERLQSSDSEESNFIARPIEIRPHNLPLANIGMFLLVFSWYGFNMGSSPTEDYMPLIALNTMISGAAGGSIVFLYGKITHSPTLSLNINGVLGGLVAITSCANIVGNFEAAVIGGLAGILVVSWLNTVVGTPFISKHFEDPVGAFPVHGLCGLLGGVAVCVFGGDHRLINVQGIEIALFDVKLQLAMTFLAPFLAFCAVFTFLCIYDLFANRIIPRNLVKSVVASPEEQGLGLDVVDYVERAYDFGERSDKPEDLFEQLNILINKFPTEHISFEKCAADKGNYKRNSNQPFTVKFAYWIDQVSRIAFRYSEAFGGYAADANENSSAKNIAERIDDSERRLRQYTAEPDRPKKKMIFDQNAKELKNSIDTLHRILQLHIEERVNGRQIVEATARDIERIQTDVDLLTAKLENLRNKKL